MNEKRLLPGEFVDSVTCAEVLRSTGIQLAGWAYDISFTDAAFGEDWSVETANRMASLSELLYVVLSAVEPTLMATRIKLPEGMTGQIAINPRFQPDSTPPAQKSEDEVAGKERGESSIGDLPF